MHTVAAIPGGVQKGQSVFWTIDSLEEFGEFADRFTDALPVYDDRATVVALHGDLGAGKTTFVQCVATHAGVAERVTSPTFVIMKSYPVLRANFATLIHVDAYRIEDTGEVSPLRLAEACATPKTLLMIEWAERIAPVLPQNTIHLTFKDTGDGTRTISYEASHA